MNPPHSPFVGMFTKEWKAGASGQWFSNMAVQHNHLGNLGGKYPYLLSHLHQLDQNPWRRVPGTEMFQQFLRGCLTFSVYENHSLGEVGQFPQPLHSLSEGPCQLRGEQRPSGRTVGQ